MDRPDCLSLSYSAARLCYEDSKQMRSLHLLPHHALGKKKTYFKHSDGYLNICSINPKRFLPKPCCQLCAHDERCCSLLWQGSKAAGAKGSPRGSQHQGGWAGTPAHAMESTGELQHGHGECVTNVWCQGIIPIPRSADWKSALSGIALLPVGLGASKGPAPRPPPAANGKAPIWRMTGF